MSYKKQYGDCNSCPVKSICSSPYAIKEVICENEDNQTPEELEQEYYDYIDNLGSDWVG